MDLIPGQGIKIPHVCDIEKKKRNTWKVQGRQMDFNKIELTEMESPHYN